jgi:hypothetical protein
MMQRKKAAFWTRPVGTSSRHEVSHNYFGCVADALGTVVAGFGGVVAGLVGVGVGFAPAGFAAGAGTPDCAL